MKIAYIVRNYDLKGGISGYTAALAGRMSLNNEVHVYAASFDGAPLNVRRHLIPSLSSAYLKKHKKHALNVALEVASFMWSSKNRIGEDEYDIIHSQGDFLNDCDIYTAHSCHKAWLETANAANMGFIEKLRKSSFNPLHALILKSEYYGIMKSKKIIAVSNSVKNELIAHYPQSAGKIEVIYNGVDTKRFNPQNRPRFRETIRKEYSLKDKDILAVFPAHEFKRKGILQIIQAMKILNRDDFFLLVVGRDDPAKYEAGIKGSGLEKQILFAGEQPAIEKQYAAADLMLFPTLYEPFGLVITEAMASGLPVIVSASAGAAELITDGRDGLLIKDRNDSKEIAGKIKYIADNREGILEMAESARRRAENFSWQNVAGQIYSLYESVLKEKK